MIIFVLQIRWELQGLDTFYKDHYQINIDVRGSLYPERKGKHSWLKNQMVMKITFCPKVAFIPENLLQDAIELVRLPLLTSIVPFF